MHLQDLLPMQLLRYRLRQLQVFYLKLKCRCRSSQQTGDFLHNALLHLRVRLSNQRSCLLQLHIHRLQVLNQKRPSLPLVSQLSVNLSLHGLVIFVNVRDLFRIAPMVVLMGPMNHYHRRRLLVMELEL